MELNIIYRVCPSQRGTVYQRNSGAKSGADLTICGQQIRATVFSLSTEPTKRENGKCQRRPARNTPDSAWLLLQLSLSGSVRLRGAGEARRDAAQPVALRRVRRVAPHADIRGAALHLEQLPAGRKQTGETPDPGSDHYLR